MAHNLFGERFYGHRDAAWHKLGIVTEEGMSANEAFAALGGYYFDKRPVTVTLNNVAAETGDFAVVRSACPDDPEERLMGFTTKAYQIIQPQEIVDMFDRSVKQAVETMGMLGKGERMFLTWGLPEIDIEGDVVKVYGFIGAGYEPGLGVSLNVVTTRVVCENTWCAAMAEAMGPKQKEQGRGRVWTGKHNSPNVGRDLEIWMEHVQTEAEQRANAMQDMFNAFRATPITDNKTLADLLFQIYPDPAPIPDYFPAKLRDEKQAKIDKVAELAERDRTMVESLFNGAGTQITGDAWGLFNAVTEFENYGRTSKKEPEYSILFGERANVMSRAATVLNGWVNGN